VAKVVKSDEPFPERAESKRIRNDLIRDTMSKVLRIVFLFFALALALGAFLVAAHDNVSQTNSLVKVILNIAGAIDGPFSRDQRGDQGRGGQLGHCRPCLPGHRSLPSARAGTQEVAGTNCAGMAPPCKTLCD
jgi:hypothetical protein